MLSFLWTTLGQNIAAQKIVDQAKPTITPTHTTDTSAMLTIYDTKKQPKTLAPALAQGGEGTVYPVESRPDLVVKIYHSQVLRQHGTNLQQKIEAMQQLPLRNTNALSWPRLAVFNQNQQWQGYAMKLKSGFKMNALAHSLLYQKYVPTLTRRDLVEYLLDFIEQVQYLHQHDVLIGDYNLNNFLCDSQSKRVYFIDCDSYQLCLQGHYYPCLVGSPDLTPVEHHGRPYSQIIRTIESERFSLAIILFKCLMLGRHPYDIVGGEDPVKNLCQGQFPYGSGNKGIPKGPWYNIWSHMPYRLKNLFIQTFTEGAKNPHKRATLAEWHHALTLYRQEIDKGWHEIAIKPNQPKKSDYRGSQSAAVAPS